MPGKKQHSLFDLYSVQRHQNREKPVSAGGESSVQGDGESSVQCPVCGKSMAPLDMHLRIQHVETCLTLQLLQEETMMGNEGNKTAKSEGSEENGNSKYSTVQYEAQVEAILVSDSEAPVEEIKEELEGVWKRHKDSQELEEQGQEHQEHKKKQMQEQYKKQMQEHNKKQIQEHNKKQMQGHNKKQIQEQKKKRQLATSQKENLKYVNSKPRVKRPRHAKVEEPLTELLPSNRKIEIPELKVMRFPVAPQKDYCVSVDAFNFKPSEYIHQYFLSHFHSDHYGGISKRWCRERTLDSKIIYCSEITARLLQIRYNIESAFVFSMQNNLRYRVHCYEDPTSEACVSEAETPGLYATTIDANHCPGAVIFLFESISLAREKTYYLHCGDFRVCESIMNHPILKRFLLDGDLKLQKVYLDTTYMSPKYNFPKQQQVCASIADLIEKLVKDEQFSRLCFGKSMQSRITDLFSLGKAKKKLLVLVGTYLIGKERLATAISRRIDNAPIYVSNTGSRGDKEDIIRSYKDEYIDSVLTNNPTFSSDHSVMIHLVPMSTAGNIQDIAKYFNNNQYHQHFERCIGIRPTGWSFQNKEKDGDKEETGSVDILKEMRSLRQHPEYSYLDIMSQNVPRRYGKVDSSLYRSFAVPYSEHSSFRELSFFTIFFNIEKVIPTVNTSNEWSVQRMDELIQQWESIRERLKTERLDTRAELTLEDF